MRFISYIAMRYLRSRRRSGFLNRAAVIALTGITLGVAVLNLTLAIMNGFQEELQHTFVDNMPMVTVLTSEPEGFTDLGGDMDRIGAVPGVVGVAPFVRQETVISAAAATGPVRHRAAVVWGIDPDLQETVTPLRDMLFPRDSALASLRGERSAAGLVLGVELAASLYCGLGDTVVITTPTGDLSDLGHLDAESRSYVVAGLLDTGLYDFDSRFIYMSLSDARDFFGYAPDGALGIGVKVADMMQAPAVADEIESALGRWSYHCNDWIELNANLFQWVKLEKVVMFLLLGLIFVVASFNIVGILTMMVGERSREIGILISMGARRRQIQGVFMLDGLLVGAGGVALGTLLGWLGTLYLQKVGIGLPGDVYFVDRVPVLVQTLDFVMVAGAALVVTLLATLLPSREAARLKPMEIIRYT